MQCPFSKYLIRRASSAPHLSPSFHKYILSKCPTRRVGGVEVLKEFAEVLREFYYDSNFEDFWSSHLDFYRKVEENANERIKLNKIVNVLEEYFGIKKREYHVVLLLLSKHSYGYRINHSIVYSFIDPTRISDGGIPEYRGDVIIREFSHSFINPITEEFLEEFKNPEALLEPVRDKLRNLWGELLGPLKFKEELLEEISKNWESYINEHLVEAVKLKIAEELGFLDSLNWRKRLNATKTQGSSI